MRTRLAVALLGSAPLLLAVASLAQEKAPVSLSAEHTTRDVLMAAKEKEARVVVLLRNGTQYAAQVKDVGAHAVVLKNASGKEFFEIYVVQSEIAAVEVRVRDR